MDDTEKNTGGTSFSIGVSTDLKDKIEKLLEEAGKSPGANGPFIYGFNLRFDETGKPVLNEFGNVSAEGVHQVELREPLTDVIERPQDVTVIIELPGVDEKEIDLKIQADGVCIDVESQERRYKKDIKLSCKIDPKTAKSEYKNGVLQILMNRVA